jgi:hypothetical protein
MFRSHSLNLLFYVVLWNIIDENPCTSIKLDNYQFDETKYHIVSRRNIPSCAKILEQSMGPRNRIGIGLPYRPARLQACGIVYLVAIPARLLKKGKKNTASDANTPIMDKFATSHSNNDAIERRIRAFHRLCTYVQLYMGFDYSQCLLYKCKYM